MLHEPRTPCARDERGTTMIELIAVLSIVGVLMATGAFSFSSWLNTSRHQGAAEELVSTLRNASTRAVSEGRTYCLDIKPGGTRYELWRYSCGGAAPAVAAGAVRSTQSADVSYTVLGTQPTTPACPSTSRCLYFYPRGTALPAAVEVRSTRRPAKTYTVRVEGLTARVYL